MTKCFSQAFRSVTRTNDTVATCVQYMHRDTVKRASYIIYLCILYIFFPALFCHAPSWRISCKVILIPQKLNRCISKRTERKKISASHPNGYEAPMILLSPCSPEARRRCSNRIFENAARFLGGFLGEMLLFTWHGDSFKGGRKHIFCFAL